MTEDKDSERFSIPVAAESSMLPCGWCWWGASIVLGAESAAIMSIYWVLGPKSLGNSEGASAVLSRRGLAVNGAGGREGY